MGATVIKVEIPDSGDDTRANDPPFLNGESTYHARRTAKPNIAGFVAYCVPHR
jgi:crotonobetainyl-CoA:carnitine CoA-transferase CaiB-like acyl-CoA transferase